jgi:cytochrome b-561 domain-containing protein 2
LLLIGVSSIIYNKYVHGAPHFVSAHGKMGLAIISWIIVQGLIGLVASQASKTYGDSARRFYKYHRLSGYILLPLVLVTAHLGGSYSDFMLSHSRPWMRIVAFDLGLALIAVGVVVRAR